MTDLLLKSIGPVADQYRVLAGDQVVGHIRLSESAPPATPWRWTLSHGQHKGRRTPHARLRGNSRGGVAGVRQELEEGMNE